MTDITVKSASSFTLVAHVDLASKDIDVQVLGATVPYDTIFMVLDRLGSHFRAQERAEISRILQAMRDEKGTDE